MKILRLIRPIGLPFSSTGKLTRSRCCSNICITSELGSCDVMVGTLMASFLAVGCCMADLSAGDTTLGSLVIMGIFAANMKVRVRPACPAILTGEPMISIQGYHDVTQCFCAQSL